MRYKYVLENSSHTILTFCCDDDALGRVLIDSKLVSMDVHDYDTLE